MLNIHVPYESNARDNNPASWGRKAIERIAERQDALGPPFDPSKIPELDISHAGDVMLHDGTKLSVLELRIPNGVTVSLQLISKGAPNASPACPHVNEDYHTDTCLVCNPKDANVIES